MRLIRILVVALFWLESTLVFSLGQEKSGAIETDLPKSPQRPRLIKKFKPVKLVPDSAIKPYTREEFEPVIKKLNATLSKIDSISGKGWMNMVSDKDENGLGWAIHSEFAFKKSPESMKYIYSYIRPDVEIRSGLKFDQFIPTSARIETPEFTLKGDGLLRRGIESVRISRASENSSYGTRIGSIYYAGFQGKTPDQFLNSVDQVIERGKFEVRLKKAMHLVVLLMWHKSGNISSARKWVFDTSKGGIIVHQEMNWDINDSRHTTHTFEFKKGFWIPQKTLFRKIDRKNQLVKLQTETLYYEFDLNKPLKGVFDPSTIPLRNNKVQIRDVRR